ncbi:hypothetical protein DBR41_16505, partial [Pseudomonas sp. HMWF010]
SWAMAGIAARAGSIAPQNTVVASRRFRVDKAFKIQTSNFCMRLRRSDAERLTPPLAPKGRETWREIGGCDAGVNRF